MNPKVKGELEAIKESVSDKVQPIATVGVFVPRGVVARINDALSGAIHHLNKPEPPPSYNRDIKKAERYLVDMIAARKDYEDALDYVIDEILGLADNPKIQAYRLSGGKLTAESRYDQHCKFWFLDMVGSNKDKLLRIIFSQE